MTDWGYRLVMVSNQDGLGSGQYPQKSFDEVQNFIMDLLFAEGITFDAIFIDNHFFEDRHPNRKPEIGMLIPFLKEHDIDLLSSYVIGDRPTDALMAKNIGCRSLSICDKRKSKEQ